MKKILLLAAVALLTSISVFAQEQQEEEQKQIQIQQAQPQESAKEKERSFDFMLNFTNFGTGLYMPFNGPILEVSFELLRVGIEGKGAHFGITFSPLNFYGMVGRGENGKGISGSMSFSFVNLAVHWNMLSFLDFSDNFFIGPYGSFSYLFLNPNPRDNEKSFYADKFIVGAGLQGGIRGNSEKIKYNIFTIETGFRLLNDNYVKNEPKFYAGIKFDFVMNSLKNGGVFK